MTYRLADFGCYTAGGRVHKVSEGEPELIRFTRMTETLRDPRGHYAIEHAHVEYYVPENRLPGPPVVLVHGGGMCGSCWDTTPDGRPGWLQLLLAQCYEVHVIDAAERGRAGFAPGIWDGDPILRSMEEAWSLFRIGPEGGFAKGTTHPGQQFPVESFEAFARSFVPRWLTTAQIQASALAAVLRRLGRAVVICHSQGGEITFDAMAEVPECIAGLIALEPSGLPESTAVLADVPLVLAVGDFLDSDPRWQERADQWRDFAAELGSHGTPVSYLDSASFGPGNTHMLMSDRSNAEVLVACMSALNENTSACKN